MENKNYSYDPAKVSEADRRALEAYQQAQKQLQSLQDIADMMQELVTVSDENKTNTDQLKALGAILADSREQLTELNKKELPETPDTSKPIVDAISKLEKALKIPAPQVSVASPNVQVDAPDLTQFNKILQTELPKAFKEAIKLIPKTDVVIPEAPDRWDEVIKWLQDIDTGTRMKPIAPTVLKVTNLDGTSIADMNLKQSNTIRFASVSVSSSGDNSIVALVSAKKIKVLSCLLVASGTVSVKWRSNTIDLSGAMPLVANSGFVLPASSPGQGHYFETVAGETLNLNLSGAVQVSGHISYYLEA